MRNQEQTFRAYYASMTDAELLRIADNERSFLAVVQKVMDSELARRRLTPAPPPLPPPRHSVLREWGRPLAKWARRLHLHPTSP